MFVKSNDHDKALTSEFTFHVTNTEEVQTGFDFYMNDTRNVPESVHLVPEIDNFLYSNKSSVIVKNVLIDSSKSEYSIVGQSIPMDLIPVKKSTIVETTNFIGDDDYSELDDDSEKEMKTNCDIEALVDECFAAKIK